MRAPRAHKPAPKAGRRAAARAAAAPTTQVDDLPDSVLGLIFCLAGGASGPSIAVVSRRWRRVWLTEPAVWRKFVLRPVPPPVAALRLASLVQHGKENWSWPPPSNEGDDGSQSGTEAEADEATSWWDGAGVQQLVAGFAARRRQLEQTAHLVTHAHLPYAYSCFREQARLCGGWQLGEVLRALPASLESLKLDSWMDGGLVGSTEANALAAATTDALNRFPHLTALQLHASVLPRQAAVALARLTSLCSLKLQASDLAEAVVDSALGLPGLTRLSIFTPRGLLPAQHLAELPQRLPLLVHLKLGEGVVQGPPLEDAQLPAPADFPHLRTYEFNFDFDQRRRFKIDGFDLESCSYQEVQRAGGAPPSHKLRMDAADPGGRRGTQWPVGPLQGRLLVGHATLPPGATLQQLLERLLPRCGLSLGALELEELRCTPAQCSPCPLLGQVNDLALHFPRCLPDGYTSEEADEEDPYGPEEGSPADLARRETTEPVLAALMAQMPELERLLAEGVLPEGAGVPACIRHCTSLRSLELGMPCVAKQLPPGPYLHNLETLLLDCQAFEELPRALAAATRCRFLSMNTCSSLKLTNRDVDDILLKMAALEELHIHKQQSWNPTSFPLPLLRYLRKRLPNVRVVAMDSDYGGGSSGLSDDDGSEWEDDGSSWDGSEEDSGSSSGWDSSEAEEEEGPPPGTGSSRGRAGSSRQAAAAKPKPAARGRPAAKGRAAAGAAKSKNKQPAKAKAAAAPKLRVNARGQGAAGKQKQQQPARNRKGGKN